MHPLPGRPVVCATAGPRRNGVGLLNEVRAFEEPAHWAGLNAGGRAILRVVPDERQAEGPGPEIRPERSAATRAKDGQPGEVL